MSSEIDKATPLVRLQADSQGLVETLAALELELDRLVVLKPSEGLLAFLAAVRARNVDGVIAE